MRLSASRRSTSLRSRSIAPAGSSLAQLISTSCLSLAVATTGCGARGDASENDRALALAVSSPPSPLTPREGNAVRSREGSAGPLRQLARDADVMQTRPRPAAEADAGIEVPAPPSSADAGTVEPLPPEALPPEPLPAEPSELDAGAGEPAGDAAPPAEPLPPEALPPEPLPRDIVARAALPIHGLEAGVVLTEAALWDRLAASSAVCFGEFHDVPAHHYAQTRALDELAARAASAGHTFAVGFEMIQRPYQAPLGAFVAGELGEDDFLAQTEYLTRWGYDFALYRPLFEGARDRNATALALNMRAEITRKIGRTGLVSLDAAELAELPELDLTDEEHRAYIFGLFGVLPEHGAELGLEDIYTAQTVWDETMADTSARWLAETGAGARLLDIAGGAHCHRSAIPRRITRRTPDQPALSVHAVFESELTDGSFTPEGYDVLVVLED